MGKGEKVGAGVGGAIVGAGEAGEAAVRGVAVAVGPCVIGGVTTFVGTGDPVTAHDANRMTWSTTRTSRCGMRRIVHPSANHAEPGPGGHGDRTFGPSGIRSTAMDLPDLGRPLPASAVPGEPPSLVELVRRGTVDAELAALVWVLVEARIPLVVAAPTALVAVGAAGEILRGIVASLRPDLGLAGVDASDLATPLGVRSAREIIHGERPGGVARAESLQALRDDLGAEPPAGLTDDELSFLGCVLVLGEDAPGPIEAADPAMAPERAIRVTAAHYVRPLHRDERGHAQLLGPAVLAIWDSGHQTFEHFAWGVLPEIAARLGRRTGDLEADLHHRRDDVGGLAAAGVTSLDEVGRLIAGYRVGYGHAHGSGAAH